MANPVRFGIISELQPQSYPSPSVGFGNLEERLAEAILYNENVVDDFKSAVVISAVNADSGALLPSEAAQGAEIAFSTSQARYEQHLSVVESTGTALYAFPKVTTGGLSLPLDADVTDGVTGAEITNGITARAPGAVVVGASPTFFVEAEISIVDISDLDQLIIGFRKAEAYQADPNNYDELAAIHVGETGSTVADGQINTMTILNNAATVFTDTTAADWADAGQHTLRVQVARSGKVSYFLDDVALAGGSFSFDADEVIVPFLYIDNATGSTTGDPGIVLINWKAGKL